MCSAAKLQAAANEPEAGFGMDVRGGLGGGVPAPSLSAASALVAGFCEGSSIGVAATFLNTIDHLGIGFFHWTVGFKSFIYMRMHVY